MDIDRMFDRMLEALNRFFDFPGGHFLGVATECILGSLLMAYFCYDMSEKSYANNSFIFHMIFQYMSIWFSTVFPIIIVLAAFIFLFVEKREK